MEIAQDGGPLYMVYPYINFNCLRTCNDKNPSWRLLTDVKEWRKFHTVNRCEPIVNWIEQHQERVRHCKDLHAKVMIDAWAAMVGSANFTNKGLVATGRSSSRLEARGSHP